MTASWSSHLSVECQHFLPRSTHAYTSLAFQISAHYQPDIRLLLKPASWSPVTIPIMYFYKPFYCCCSDCSLLFVSVSLLLFVHMEDTNRDQCFQPKGCRVSALVIVCNYPANLFTSAGAAQPLLGITSKKWERGVIERNDGPLMDQNHDFCHLSIQIQRLMGP